MLRIEGDANRIAGDAVPADAGSALTGPQVTYTMTRRIDMPAEALKKKRIVSGVENDATGAAYKLLRTQILQRMKSHGWNTLAVTSTAPGEGKTLTAINLAISIARDLNHTVLLVDADLRRPSISRYFGCSLKFGLYDYLVHEVALPEILFNPGIDRLVVLPGSNSVSNSSELLTSPKMVHLAEEMKGRYAGRIVIFDMPPLLVTDDVLAFAPHLDAALLVLQDGKTRKQGLMRALEMLQVVNVVGTVLNMAQQTSQPYGYY